MLNISFMLNKLHCFLDDLFVEGYNDVQLLEEFVFRLAGILKCESTNHVDLSL